MGMQETEAVVLPEIMVEERSMPRSIIASLKLPDDLLASDEEISAAWLSVSREVNKMPPLVRNDLVAKMCIAVRVGLLDSAINYIWNAAVVALREKVKTFGLPVASSILGESLDEKQLCSKSDADLLRICLNLNLISEDGSFFLSQCRDTRNNFSAAHPAMGKINDSEFSVFLNRCNRYALCQESNLQGVPIGDLMKAVKRSKFSAAQLEEWAGRVKRTHQGQQAAIVGMLHGVYCDPRSEEHARQNGLKLCKAIASQVDPAVFIEAVRRHSDYMADGKEKQHSASRRFFEELNALYLLDNVEQQLIIIKAIDRLWQVHNSIDNFYNEPPYAERLLELSQQIAIPASVQEQFVQVVTYCYIGNQWGYSWVAEQSYAKMIEGFSPKEVAIMLKRAGKGGELRRFLDSSLKARERFRKAVGLVDGRSIPESARLEYEEWLK